MTRTIFSAVLAAALMASPLPAPNASAQTTTSAPAKPASDAKTTKTTKAPSAGVTAMRERQKKCGAEWKEAKAAGKIEKGMKWPQYWSACNKRLKAAAS